MKLIKQLIEKNLELYEEYKLKRFYRRSIWKFYSAFNIAISFRNVKMIPIDIIQRNKFYQKIILLDKIEDNQFKKIEFFMRKDLDYILECLEILDNVQNEKYQLGDIYVPGMIAISSYEFEV